MTNAAPTDGHQPAQEAGSRLRAAPGWYKDAVIYQAHVKSFFDANDDGIGDFPGITAKLDYIASLGVDTLWLLPFYPSPRRDDGYDVADYFGVHPDYGSLDDLRAFLAAAHARGLRVLGDLVLNHTSDQHAWFQRARHAPRDSAEHAFYVWSDTDQRYPGTRIIFPDVEKSNWTWDPVAERYYFHRFYSHQPDLNFDNPQVIEAAVEVMKFWLDLGLDGFRLDAVAYLVERDGTSNENLPETHAILRRLRAEMEAHYPDRVLLAEANQWPEDMQEYFGQDDECHMAFHFPLMPRMYMAIAQEDRFPVSDILRQTPRIPPMSQWAIFLRNHDELTLEMVTDAERDYLWNTYAADPRARINLGIRRRLAPLLQRDRRRIELMTALLLTLPGTPVMYYGDEIGMGDNIHLGDRDGVRTPMQWSMDRNGGFSRADAQQLVLPAIMDPLYGYHAVNVEVQERDPHSLLHWTRRWLAVRRRYGGLFGRGELRFLYPRNRKVLVYLREFEGVTLLCVANLSRNLQGVELDLGEFEARVPVDIVGGAALPPIARGEYLVTLPPYGFHAFELAGERLPDWHAPESEPLPELETVVVRGTLAEALGGTHRERLEQDLLARCLPEAHAGPARIDAVLPLGPDAVLVDLARADGSRRRVPLAIAWSGADEARPSVPSLCRIRRGARMGRLVVALASRETLEAWRDAWSGLAQPDATLRFVTQPGRQALPEPRSTAVETVGPGGDVVATLLDRSLLIHFAGGGEDPLARPLAVARALEAVAFPHRLPLVGTLHAPGGEAPGLIAFAQEWLPTLGDAALWLTDFLRRVLHEASALDDAARSNLLEGSDALVQLVGTRLAGLHAALEDAHDERARVAPAALRELAEASGEVLRRLQPRLLEAGATPDAVRAVLAHLARIAASPPRIEACRIDATHGNLALSNLLLDSSDLVFVHFADASKLVPLHGHACRIADLADLVLGIESACCAVPQDNEAAERFVDEFRRRARARLLAAYRESRPAASFNDADLDVFIAWRGVKELESVQTSPAALAAGWCALQTGLD